MSEEVRQDCDESGWLAVTYMRSQTMEEKKRYLYSSARRTVYQRYVSSTVADAKVCGTVPAVVERLALRLCELTLYLNLLLRRRLSVITGLSVFHPSLRLDVLYIVFAKRSSTAHEAEPREFCASQNCCRGALGNFRWQQLYVVFLSTTCDKALYAMP